MTLRLRPATRADAGLLLRWRNDPETRRFAFDHDVIDATGHQAWLAASLADVSRQIWIAEDAGGAVGQIRLDRLDNHTALVDIATGPGHRGKGYAGAMLDRVERLAPWGTRTLRAEVDARNAASLRLFEKAGFNEIKRTEDRVVLERLIERPEAR